MVCTLHKVIESFIRCFNAVATVCAIISISSQIVALSLRGAPAMQNIRCDVPPLLDDGDDDTDNDDDNSYRAGVEFDFQPLSLEGIIHGRKRALPEVCLIVPS